MSVLAKRKQIECSPQQQQKKNKKIKTTTKVVISTFLSSIFSVNFKPFGCKWFFGFCHIERPYVMCDCMYAWGYFSSQLSHTKIFHKLTKPTKQYLCSCCCGKTTAGKIICKSACVEIHMSSIQLTWNDFGFIESLKCVERLMLSNNLIICSQKYLSETEIKKKKVLKFTVNQRSYLKPFAWFSISSLHFAWASEFIPFCVYRCLFLSISICFGCFLREKCVCVFCDVWTVPINLQRSLVQYWVRPP